MFETNRERKAKWPLKFRKKRRVNKTPSVKIRHRHATSNSKVTERCPASTEALTHKSAQCSLRLHAVLQKKRTATSAGTVICEKPEEGSIDKS